MFEIINPLGVRAIVNVNPAVVSADEPALHTVEVVVERGCEAVSVVIEAKSSAGLLLLDGEPEWNSVATMATIDARASRTARKLPVVSSEVTCAVEVEREVLDGVTTSMDASDIGQHRVGSVSPVTVPVVIKSPSKSKVS